MAELIDRGWVRAAAGDDEYVVSETGREVRQTAEGETDRLYYAPWAVLNQTQLERVCASGLTRLTAGLAELAEPMPA